MGISTAFQKHVVVTFQASLKPWRVGEFTINVHISNDFELFNLDPFARERFAQFDVGFYRLSSMSDRDKWWCLEPVTSESQFDEYWRPSSYDDDSLVVQEALADVRSDLEKYLLRRGGFVI